MPARGCVDDVQSGNHEAHCTVCRHSMAEKTIVCGIWNVVRREKIQREKPKRNIPIYDIRHSTYHSSSLHCPDDGFGLPYAFCHSFLLSVIRREIEILRLRPCREIVPGDDSLLFVVGIQVSLAVPLLLHTF